jgi:biotin carboxyl carrier protein
VELNEIQQLIAWLEASGMRSLELNRAGEYLRLTVSGGDHNQIGNLDGASGSSTPPAEGTGRVALAESAGIFLSAHPMRSTPFVKIGDTVRKNDVVGLLKTGLIYAPVTAPSEGVVSKIVATDGEMIGYGSPVLELSPVR